MQTLDAQNMLHRRIRGTSGTSLAPVRIRRFMPAVVVAVCWLLHTNVAPALPDHDSANAAVSQRSNRPVRRRRILYNFDGDSCMFTRAGGKGPVAITVSDLKTHIREISYKGSQVDTMLLCINAQVMYYPTKVGTMRGTLSTPEQRAKWTAPEKQQFVNRKHFFDAGIDPYAVMLAEAKRRGLEALLTFRMNDAHGLEFLRTKFWIDHPAMRLSGRGNLDFSHDEVRDYVFRLIREAVRRYDCDGIELDFQRFPTFFKGGTTEERIAKINSLVKRVRKMLDEEGQKRKRHLVLAARIPSDYDRTPPSYDTSRKIGCDPAVWANNGWVDFLTVSEFLYERYDLPIAPWKKLISKVPIYGSIEGIQRGRPLTMTPEEYRRAARHLWKDGADGIYLFNFFTPRVVGPKTTEPPFGVIREIGSRNGLLQEDQP